MTRCFPRSPMLVNPALLAVALLFGLPAVALAHDPGLSVLEVRVSGGRVAADLMLAAVDADAARRLAQSADGDLGAFALQAVELLVDGRRIQATVDEVAIDSSQGFRVRLEYARASGSQLTVKSSVPLQLASGHRELVSIRGEDGSLVTERMLSAHGNEVSADLKIGGSGHLLPLAALLMAVLAAGYWRAGTRVTLRPTARLRAS